MNSKAPLFVFPHLGLGDFIVSNALLRMLSAKYTRLIVPCKVVNRPTVSAMFSDTNILFVWVDDDRQADQWADRCKGHAGMLQLGCHAGPIAAKWDQQLYEQAGIPFACRWDNFVLPWNAPPQYRNYPPFLHEDIDRGYCIHRSKTPQDAVPVARTRIMFESLHWLQNAPEIHCIDSSWMCLADSVETKAKRLVFHKYARPNGLPPTLRKTWEVL